MSTEEVFALKKFVDADQLAKDLTIHPDNLDDAMMTQASKFARYAELAAQARRQYERIKAAFEILESRLDGEYREILKKENPKTTEAQIKAAVQQDKRWSGAQSRLIEAQTIQRFTEDAKEAVASNKDLILELARDRRQERVGQLRLTEAMDSRERLATIMRESGVLPKVA